MDFRHVVDMCYQHCFRLAAPVGALYSFHSFTRLAANRIPDCFIALNVIYGKHTHFLPNNTSTMHGRLARRITWRACDGGERLENELWRRWSNGRVGEWAVTVAQSLSSELRYNHGRFARWINGRDCDVGEAKEGLEYELWHRWSKGRVGELAVTVAQSLSHELRHNHARFARWIKWWRRRSERRVGVWTVTYVKQRKGWRMSCDHSSVTVRRSTSQPWAARQVN